MVHTKLLGFYLTWIFFVGGGCLSHDNAPTSTVYVSLVLLGRDGVVISLAGVAQSVT